MGAQILKTGLLIVVTNRVALEEGRQLVKRRNKAHIWSEYGIEEKRHLFFSQDKNEGLILMPASASLQRVQFNTRHPWCVFPVCNTLNFHCVKVKAYSVWCGNREVEQKVGDKRFCCLARPRGGSNHSIILYPPMQQQNCCSNTRQKQISKYTCNSPGIFKISKINMNSNH